MFSKPCRNCGLKVSRSDNVCPRCGARSPALNAEQLLATPRTYAPKPEAPPTQQNKHVGNVRLLAGVLLVAGCLFFAAQSQRPPTVSTKIESAENGPAAQPKASTLIAQTDQLQDVSNPPVPPQQTLVPPGIEKPSFDCNRARAAAARLICADAELARLDGELGAAFQKRKAQISGPDQTQFVADQLAWIRDRNTHCELIGKSDAAIEVLVNSKPCMVNAIRERIGFLAQTASTGTETAQAAPTAPLALVPPQSQEETLSSALGVTNSGPIPTARQGPKPQNSTIAMAQQQPLPAFDQTETVAGDEAWQNRIDHGACSLIGTSTPPPKGACNYDYAQTPPCVNYRGVAQLWAEWADKPPANMSFLLTADAELKRSFGIPERETTLKGMVLAWQHLNIDQPGPVENGVPAIDSSRPYQEALHGLLDVAFSPDRGSKWGTPKQFADSAYAACMTGSPLKGQQSPTTTSETYEAAATSETHDAAATSETHNAAAALKEAVATRAVNKLQMKPNWERVGIDKKDPYLLTLYYRTAPLSRYEIEADTKTVARALLSEMAASGTGPSSNSDEVFVFTVGREKGETGKDITYDYGYTYYNPRDDQLHFCKPMVAWSLPDCS